MNIVVETEGFIRWITLNRPDASNAYTPLMITDLVKALVDADADSQVRVIVLTGAGKNFCAGGDVKSMKARTGMFSGEPNALREIYQSGIQQIPLAMTSLKKPVIAMVNGAAVGAGCDLAAMCDMRVASNLAQFSETFARIGLVPGDGGAFFVSKLVGMGKAMEMFLTCRSYSATEALSMGLVNEVVAHEELRSRVKKIAEQIASLPPIAIQMTKKAVQHAQTGDLRAHLDLMAAFQGITQRTVDHFEALDGLLEKKNPTFHHN